MLADVARTVTRASARTASLATSAKLTGTNVGPILALTKERVMTGSQPTHVPAWPDFPVRNSVSDLVTTQ